MRREEARQLAMSKSEQTLSIKSGYILVERPPGYEVVLTEQSARLMEILALCKQADCRKVLVLGQNTDVRLLTVDIFDLGVQIAELGLQIAVVESHDAPDKDVKFLENVVANRGDPIQFFDNTKDAKDWLGVE